MKYSLQGFNQAKLLETDLDCIDLHILNYISFACGSPTMKHLITEEDHTLVWICHEKFHEDLPFLRLSESTLKNRLTALRKGGYLESKTVANQNVRGTRTYYGVTELTMSLVYDATTCQNLDVKTESEMTTSQKKDVIERPRTEKSTSNNTLTIDNKLKDSISKDILKPTETTKDISENSKSTDIVKEKPKKENLYQKCYNLIEEYTDDEKLRDLLDSYLRMRLSMKDKPLYGVNQFRGILNKLSVIGGDPFEIVSFCIERGYASFYPPNANNYSAKNNNKRFSQSSKISSEKVTQEEMDNGYFTGEIV